MAIEKENFPNGFELSTENVLNFDNFKSYIAANENQLHPEERLLVTKFITNLVRNICFFLSSKQV